MPHLFEMIAKTYIEYRYVDRGVEKSIRFGFGSDKPLDDVVDWEMMARRSNDITFITRSQTTFNQVK